LKTAPLLLEHPDTAARLTSWFLRGTFLMPEAVSRLLIPFLACFVAGSIPFAVLAMAGTGIDIRRVGSGNPGFNNVLRVSKGRAVIALIGDVGKGLLPVWYFYRVHPVGDGIAAAWILGFAAVLGHCYSPFLKFNGGKGIATSAGIMLVLYPVWAAAALAAFVIVRITGSRLKWREAGAIASIGSSVFFALLILATTGSHEAAYAGLLTLFLAWRHKKNFQNLFGPPSKPASLASQR
jgi:acyl phosphate:glycerol-3-phosphate acyltransferase